MADFGLKSLHIARRGAREGHFSAQGGRIPRSDPLSLRLDPERLLDPGVGGLELPGTDRPQDFTLQRRNSRSILLR